MNKYVIAFLFFLTVSIAPSYAQQMGGIGAQLLLDTMGGHSMPQVSGLVPNSAADQNLKATDYIIKVNGVSCEDKTLEQIIGMIRGEIGTTVKVTVADTKQGKRPREYDLLRGSIGLPASTSSSADQVTTFNGQCESQIAKMKKSGNTIIKTFPSECGNYFFNFDADKGLYHIRVWAVAEKSNAGETFSMAARVFDNTKEAEATQITKFDVVNGGNVNTCQLDGTATFSKPGIGVVNVLLNDDKKKCRAMYVVIYK